MRSQRSWCRRATNHSLKKNTPDIACRGKRTGCIQRMPQQQAGSRDTAHPAPPWMESDTLYPEPFRNTRRCPASIYPQRAAVDRSCRSCSDHGHGQGGCRDWLSRLSGACRPRATNLTLSHAPHPANGLVRTPTRQRRAILHHEARQHCAHRDVHFLRT